MFENPTRGRRARNFITNVPKTLDLKIVFRTDISRKLTLGAPGRRCNYSAVYLTKKYIELFVGTTKTIRYKCASAKRVSTVPLQTLSRHTLSSTFDLTVKFSEWQFGSSHEKFKVLPWSKTSIQERSHVSFLLHYLEWNRDITMRAF